ncbi:hypothetical protein TRFO_07901 [Tritrichomonas foetus]|uniref:E3 ubiquitin-protein ligase n=1 Tax=Tritrichomonas foetus TaxID=1144522 RepID=A0A1J4JQ79_9EUKA|nr:hypothetical protein TRFO_07901 [Tritrichomonas foetus]|eukprot:OHT00568.1 hypothetical protein TRFO_07901 [Tritrichomonas foetus]
MERRLKETFLIAIKKDYIREVLVYAMKYIENGFEKTAQFPTIADYLKSLFPPTTCDKSQKSEMLVISCKDCALNSNSLMCVECYLNSIHMKEKHRISVFVSELGTCSCGDPTAWKQSGFCCKHNHEIKNPELKIPKELREKFEFVFNELYNYFIDEFNNSDYLYRLNHLLPLITSLTQWSEGVRRLVGKIFSQQEFIVNLLNRSITFDLETSFIVNNFISALMDDYVFRQKAAISIIQNFIPFYKLSLRSTNDNVFFSITPMIITESVFNLGINFDNIIQNMIKATVEFLYQSGEYESNSKISVTGHIFNHFFNFLRKSGDKNRINNNIIQLALSYKQIEGFSPNHISDHLASIKFMEIINKLLHYLRKNEFNQELFEIFIDYLSKATFEKDLDPNKDIEFSMFLNLHYLAIETLKQSNSISEICDRYSIFIKSLDIPLFILVNSMLSTFAKCNQHFKSILNQKMKQIQLYSNKNFITYLFYPLFSLIQIHFCNSSNKSEFIDQIAKQLQIFNDNTIGTHKERMFILILIVSSLVFDRVCFDSDKNKLTKYVFITKNKNPNREYPNKPYIDFISSMKIDISYNSLKEKEYNESWNIVLPFFSPKHLYQKYIPMLSNNNQVILPFPEYVFYPKLAGLNDSFHCKYIFALIFEILYECQDASIQYALNLFIVFYQNSINQTNDNKTTQNYEIHANSFHELYENIPDNFKEFYNAKIEYKKCGCFLTCIKLIEKIGNIGISFLKEVGLYHKKITKTKEEIQKIKNDIIEEYNQKLHLYQEKHLKLFVDVDSCYIYSQKLYIPVNIITSSVNCQIHLNRPKDDSDFEEHKILTSCSHFLITDPNQGGYCPICNAKFVTGLPRHDLQYYYEANKKLNFEISDLIFMIEILDCRSQIKPEILNDDTYYLYRNLFFHFVAYFASTYKSSIIGANNIIDANSNINAQDNPNNNINSLRLIQSMEEANSDDECNNDQSESNYNNVKNSSWPPQKYLDDVIFLACDYLNDEEGFHYAVHNFICKKQVFCLDNNHQLSFGFFKKCELISKFFVSSKRPTIQECIDWDFLFSHEQIIKTFHLTNLLKINCTAYSNLNIDNIYRDENAFDLINDNEFKLPNIPKNFLEFGGEPFNVDFFDDPIKQYNLVSGEIEFPCLDVMSNECMITLNFNGRIASSIDISNVDQTIYIPSIYVDEEGKEDSGFTRGRLLFLNEEKYISMMDDFMSGVLVTRYL